MFFFVFFFTNRRGLRGHHNQLGHLFERGLAPDLAGGGHMGGSAPAIDGPQLLDN